MRRIHPISPVTTISAKKPSFIWSFQPILICLNLIGVDLKWEQTRTRIRHSLMFWSRLFWLVNNIWSIITITHSQFANATKFTGKDAYAFHIDKIKYQIHGSGLYIALNLATWSHSHQLYKTFKQLESRFQLKDSIYVKIRAVAVIGVILSITTVLSYSVLNAVYIIDTSRMKLMMDVINVLTQIYFPVSAVMFCIFAWTLAKHFEEMEKKIDNINIIDKKIDNISVQQEDANAVLISLSVYHSLVCQAVWQLENYFKHILLLSISCIFVSVVLYSFSVIEVGSRNYTFSAVRLFEIVSLFVILDTICYVADLMKNKAIAIHKSLIKSHLLQSEIHRQQVSNLALQVRGSIPTMTITGYVVISPQLISALIWTTITYAVVLLDK